MTTLLEARAAPDTVKDDGLPALCLAIAAYDATVARALVDGGADAGQPLPDGTTPLIRAIDGGSPAVVASVLGREPRLRLPEAEREHLLALARHWYQRGAEDELRSRTGRSGPVHRAQVMDTDYHHVTQLTLGGHTVRAGHGAILTDLEWAFRILTPVDALISRAVAQHDPDHVDWRSARWVLSERRSQETWSAVTVFRHDPDPERRRFVLDVLFAYLVWSSSRRNSYEEETAELLVAWISDGEDDPGVLAEVLWVLSETDYQELRVVGLLYRSHPDPRVRARVPDLLRGWATPHPPLVATARTALLVLAGDEDWGVRVQAGAVLVSENDGSSAFTEAVVGLLRDPVAEVRSGIAQAVADGAACPAAVADALLDLLDEEDFLTRLNAAYGLLRRDDPRTGDAIERLGALSRPGFEDDHRLSALWSWKWNRDHPSAADPAT
ncbi:ankyrin repeat domain-containing protein [Streptomyces sp. H39-S7]|nr:ankyrin repeat domain-containing protein [Streptomyces sp. H39-S7]MCZ4125891.1 ankyrin repeat domain-containing protein [Streptomyces sp. H39-S7]